MIPHPQPPYCLSRQHPELAVRSPALRIPLESRQVPPVAPKPRETPDSGPEPAAGKGL
jgi:hypothetical protein